MIKKFIHRKSFFYKPYLYFRIYWLEKFFFKRKTYSQCGEDLFINKFFKKTDKGVYVDVWAYNPIKYNNTFLLYKRGWTGINIDLNQTSIDLFNLVRKKDHNVFAAISYKRKLTKVFIENIFSPLNTINKKFSNKNSRNKAKYIMTKKFSDLVRKKIDFLNIDIEGMEIDILKEVFRNKFYPWVICIEEIGKTSETVLQGDIYDLAKANGYIFASRTFLSSIYVKLDKIELMPSPYLDELNVN